MQKFERIVPVTHSALTAHLQYPEQSVFFDIETTGLHHKFSHIYLIGALNCHDHVWRLTQWFAARPGDEPEILLDFLAFLKDCKTLIHYNGDSFDLPYLQSRCAFHGITSDLECHYESLDIYRRMRPYQKILGLERFTQKAAEQFIGAIRTDPYDGSQLIAVYKEYLQTADSDMQEALLLHNQEDVVNMASLLSLEAYRKLFETRPVIQQAELDEYILHITLRLAHPLPKPLSRKSRWFSLSADENSARIEVSLFHGSLNYYYPNPKDYYYLPAEDKAIHKSIGIYVDKEHRKQATAATCYQKQHGLFAPQEELLITPYFKKQHKDSTSFFLFETRDALSKDQLEQYIVHILQVLRT